MRFFKVNGMYINLDNVIRFFIQHEGKFGGNEYWTAYAEVYGTCINLFEYDCERITRTGLDTMMKYIKEGKEEY